MVSYKPGSFTKNFGWEQSPPGLRRLQVVIQRGFNEELKPIERSAFRRQSKIRDAHRQLIPINFFLANRSENGENFVAVDELVYQALSKPYSANFDKLALFALHLSRVGKRPPNTGHQEAARYLGDYVRDILWHEGSWRSSHLSKQTIEAYLVKHVIAEGDDTVHKCVTNYHAILRLAGVRQTSSETVDLGADDWSESAIFLAFDRFSVEKPLCSRLRKSTS